jgi:hypothetical protein
MIEETGVNLTTGKGRFSLMLYLKVNVNAELCWPFTWGFEAFQRGWN